MRLIKCHYGWLFIFLVNKLSKAAITSHHRSFRHLRWVTKDHHKILSPQHCSSNLQNTRKRRLNYKCHDPSMRLRKIHRQGQTCAQVIRRRTLATGKIGGQVRQKKSSTSFLPVSLACANLFWDSFFRATKETYTASGNMGRCKKYWGSCVFQVYVVF